MNNIRKLKSVLQRGYLIPAVFLFNVAFSLNVFAQTSPEMIEKLLSPPFIARTSNFMVLAFHLDIEEAQKLLPDGVIAKQNELGLASGSLEVYTTDQAYGISNYSIAFFTIQVIAGESKLEKEGNWPVWGVVNNEASLSSFRHYFNFPYKQINKISFDYSDNVYSAELGVNDSEGLRVSLKKDEDRAVKAEGIAVIMNKSKSEELIEIEIPWLAEGNQADILLFNVNSANNEALKILQNAKPFYAQISSNVFSYSKPVK